MHRGSTGFSTAYGPGVKIRLPGSGQEIEIRLSEAELRSGKRLPEVLLRLLERRRPGVTHDGAT